MKSITISTRREAERAIYKAVETALDAGTGCLRIYYDESTQSLIVEPMEMREYKDEPITSASQGPQ